MKLKLFTPIHDMSSETYHSVRGTWSSSQLKDILDDEEYFVNKYVRKTIPRQSSPAFDIGTYFHTGVSEPHKMKDEIAVYGGSVRRGGAWDEFCERNKGKCCLTKLEATKGDALIRAVFDSPSSMEYITRAKAEVSMFVRVYVFGDVIFSVRNGVCQRLDGDGWSRVSLERTPPVVSMVPLVLKVRADLLGDDFILDLKSTTGNVKNEHKIKSTISEYKYDLSASLYLDVFSLGLGFELNQFLWTFASKDHLNAKTWRADEENVLVGRAKWTTAVVKLANLIKRDFTVEDSVGDIGPSYYEREYLKKYKPREDLKA